MPLVVVSSVVVVVVVPVLPPEPPVAAPMPSIQSESALPFGNETSIVAGLMKEPVAAKSPVLGQAPLPCETTG